MKNSHSPEAAFGQTSVRIEFIGKQTLRFETSSSVEDFMQRFTDAYNQRAVLSSSDLEMTGDGTLLAINPRSILYATVESVTRNLDS